MIKKNVLVQINAKTRQVFFSDNFLGLKAENLQNELTFSFQDNFVNGSARLEVEFTNGSKFIITELTKIGETYIMPIKSSLLANGDITMQLVITEAGEEGSIPIFKSKKFIMMVADSINASTELPDEYETLYDRIQEAIAETQNLDLDVERVEDGVEVTITKKDGSTKEVEIKDGENGPAGPQGPQGPAGPSYDDTEVWEAIDEIENNIDTIGLEIDNLDANKVPTTRKINNKQLNQDITLSPSDIGIGNVFKLKGSVSTIEDLPSTGNEIGDVYYVETEEVGYIWLEKSGTLQWEQLGLPIDLSNYYNKTETDNLINGISPIIVTANTNVTVNGYQVPSLTTENVQAIYNGIVAGKEVVVVDATETMHFKINQADSVSGEVFISFLYYDIMLLEYDENANITYKEIASKSYVDSQIGNAIEGEY